MSKYITPYIGYSLLAAILYCIPVIIFVRDPTFSQSWLLYLGNALFLGAIAFFMLTYNKKRRENAPATSMLMAGHITSILGVILAVILSLIILVLFVPGLFSSTPDVVLEEGPATSNTGNTHGLTFMILLDAVVGNIAAGSVASLLLSYTAKRDQTRDTGTVTTDRERHN